MIKVRAWLYNLPDTWSLQFKLQKRAHKISSTNQSTFRKFPRLPRREIKAKLEHLTQTIEISIVLIEMFRRLEIELQYKHSWSLNKTFNNSTNLFSFLFGWVKWRKFCIFIFSQTTYWLFELFERKNFVEWFLCNEVSNDKV